jgi:phosphoglycolate phosphatase
MKTPFALPAGLRLVLFDLDGTLVDSAPDIAVATNRLMSRYGLPRHSLNAVRAMIGNGIQMLVERAFATHGIDLDRTELAARHQEMLTIYGAHLVDLTVARPGAIEAVGAARRLGIATGVVTNKHEAFSRTILDRLGMLDQLDLVIGGDSGFANKPAPDMLLAACDAVGCSPATAVLVGDSPADLNAAKAAGMACVLLRGGYSTVPVDELGADAILPDPAALVPLLAGLRESA